MGDEAATERTQQAAARASDQAEEGRSALVGDFVRLVYAGVPARDLEDRSAEDLGGMALALFDLGSRREPGTPHVRCITPDADEHGWRSVHSAVQVITDDVPFLVDSVTMALSDLGVGIHLVVYPMLDVRRDDDGELLAVSAAGDDEDRTLTEALFHVEVDRQDDPEVLRRIERRLLEVLADVAVAVEDYGAMRERLAEIRATLEASPLPVDDDELTEALAFLAWLDEDHFTFLGYRSYDLVTEDGEDVLVSGEGTGLGILRRASRSRTRFSEQPQEVRERVRHPTVLTLTKANTKATVHRPAYLDYVGIKRFDERGETVGEWRFLGLYTSRVYNDRPEDIPVVRRTVAAVLERARLAPDSHDAKNLVDVLETYPRDELFEIDAEQLYDTAMGILNLQERRQVRLFLRRELFGRYLSCLVFVPRDRYSTHTRHAMQQVLAEAFDATDMEHSVRLSASVLARLHLVVRSGRHPADDADLDVEELERRLAAATRSWGDDLADALFDEVDEHDATRLVAEYGEAMPAGYREDHPPHDGVQDLLRIERLREDDGELATILYQVPDAPPEELRFKLYRLGAPVTLSEVLPRLEHLGCEVLDQRPYEVTPHDGPTVWLHDFGLRCPPGSLDDEDAQRTFTEAFARIWSGDSEDDRFNRLVLRPGLGWRDVSVLRTYARYLRQTTTRYSLAYVQDALADNPEVASLLVQLFHARFDPDERDEDGEQRIVEALEDELEQVASLDEDRILRGLRDLVRATLRTNHFQLDEAGEPPTHLVLKLEPTGIDWLPRPRPAFELFVSSPEVEGTHLRGGAIARGGLRWSDRREDHRTEVLGLMKAQTVKNAVIVPVGAKGGFVVRSSGEDDGPPGRDEVERCYRIFIGGLLDVTDDLRGDEVVHPDRVVRHDGEDTYLVVAADKGTASFSDVANEIATGRGFWLGDAFASGGSEGYDHKAMGITARGAWESAVQHLEELDLDPRHDEVRTIGVGDMSGDVFGNGMLRSEHLKLLGAFDHRHVFLDPDPDPAASFAAREELFHREGSTWDDYPRDALSEGAMIVPRTAKSAELTEQVRRALDVEASELSPDELIRALLRAPVDLLFNGGVGTFVKASDETHAEVGDRSTDRIRVDADELRCRVVCEGGNLGFTQRARVQYASRGGRINIDAIDNSAGVDCSDHEVNIKVLLEELVREGELTRDERDELLADMTDEVAELVLRNNRAQARAISNSAANAAGMVDVHRRLLADLAEEGLLDRDLEALPTDEELVERRGEGRGLVRPELAILLAVTKTQLADDLLASDLPEGHWYARELAAYFPTQLRDRYGDRLEEHRLRREIVATEVANRVVNLSGITFRFRLEEETGAGAPDIVRAHTIAREVFDLAGLLAAIDDPDAQVAADARSRMRLDARALIERTSRWLVRSGGRPLDVEGSVDRFAGGAEQLAELLPGPLCGTDREAAERTEAELLDAGVDEDLARRVACLPSLYCALDLVTVAEQHDEPLEDLAVVYFELGDRLHLDWLREQVTQLPRETRWEALARDALREGTFAQHRELTAAVVAATDGGEDPAARVAAWLERNEGPVRRCERMLGEIESAGDGELTALSVGLRELRNLVTAAS